jgi:hypothetical protein
MASDSLLTKNIGEEFACVGQWWLPTASDSHSSEFKRGGTLTFSRDQGIKLEIMGQLEADKPLDKLVGGSVEMIWGVSIEGEFITLFDCQSVGTTIGNIWTESYLVERVFVSKNAWFTPGERVKFTSLTLKYTHLAEWVGISGFRVPDLNEFDELIKSKKAEIIYERPGDEPPVNIRDYEVSIRFGNSWPSIGRAVQEATIKQHTAIVIEPRNSKDIAFDDALILARGIQNFLALAMYDNAVYPLVIEGQVKTEEKTSEKDSHATMRLLYAPIETKEASGKIARREMILPYKEVDSIWEGALNKLVTIKDGKLDLAFNELFAEYFSPPEFTEDKFNAVIRGLEVFQRRTRKKDCYMPKEEYRETLLKRLNEQIDKALSNGGISEDLHQSLKKQLSCGYQYSLYTRLNDLFTAYGKEFLTLFAGKEKNDFIREIVATHNWLTHSDPEYRNDALDVGKELALLNLRLELFMIALLLGYIGIPSKKIGDMFKRHKFEYLRMSSSGIQDT